MGENDMKKRRMPRRKKPCSFCIEKAASIDFKDVNKLKPLHHRTRQDYAPPHDGHVRAAPEAAFDGHKAREDRGAAAVFDRLIAVFKKPGSSGLFFCSYLLL